MSRPVILVDFGSTYTKLAAADLETRRILTTDRFPSTVAWDAREGLEQCFDAARRVLGERDFRRSRKLASSSAAGGLRMGVVGLSRSLSVQAGRSAAFGAGAKILHTCAGRLTQEDLETLEGLPLEILLFCGGYERGGTRALLENAERLAASRLHVPVIYAGNSAAASQVRERLTRSGKECWIARNLIPDVGQIHRSQVEAIIREVFLRRIVNMKGLDKVSGMLDRVVMPTPAAVLSAGELLSRGTPAQPGLGTLMIVDVGGATTDIHSYAPHLPFEGAKVVGAPEPYAKRTVEGDLGMRESAASLCREAGEEGLRKESGLDADTFRRVITRWTEENRALAETREEKRVDQTLAAAAVRLSARRHGGRIQPVASAGIKTVQHGKNLTQVRRVIGTGGPLISGGYPKEALAQVLRGPGEGELLLPDRADFCLDALYVFFAGGLLREEDEEAAFAILKESLRPL